MEASKIKNDTFCKENTDGKRHQLHPTVNVAIPNRFGRSKNGFEALDEANPSVHFYRPTKKPDLENDPLEIVLKNP